VVNTRRAKCSQFETKVKRAGKKKPRRKYDEVVYYHILTLNGTTES